MSKEGLTLSEHHRAQLDSPRDFMMRSRDLMSEFMPRFMISGIAAQPQGPALQQAVCSVMALRQFCYDYASNNLEHAETDHSLEGLMSLADQAALIIEGVLEAIKDDASREQVSAQVDALVGEKAGHATGSAIALLNETAQTCRLSDNAWLAYSGQPQPDRTWVSPPAIEHPALVEQRAAHQKGGAGACVAGASKGAAFTEVAHHKPTAGAAMNDMPAAYKGKDEGPATPRKSG